MESVTLGHNGCEGCPALCCSGLEESIIRPNTKQEVDNLKWELHFVNTQIFIRNRRWYKMTLGRCRYLNDQNLCTIYETRPPVCREHNPPDCEYHGEIYDVMFQNPDELQAYIDKEKKDTRRRAKKKAGKKGKGKSTGSRSSS